jgi:GNAT superfamily N-acetyltransferase
LTEMRSQETPSESNPGAGSSPSYPQLFPGISSTGGRKRIDPAMDEQLLDNPIWSALTTDHAPLALGDTLARRYPAPIGPLSGIADQTRAAYESLRSHAGAGGVLALFYQEPPAIPRGWTMQRDGLLSQMVCRERTVAGAVQPPPSATLRRLNTEDVPAMVALAELTEPGPFRDRTIELGQFHGAFHGDRLVAMAGQRMNAPGFTEVSAVCTHPDARGRGYARLLMTRVMDDIRERGKIPFLHSFAANSNAIRVYESLGFTLRRNLYLAVLKNQD